MINLLNIPEWLILFQKILIFILVVSVVLGEVDKYILNDWLEHNKFINCMLDFIIYFSITSLAISLLVDLYYILFL